MKSGRESWNSFTIYYSTLAQKSSPSYILCSSSLLHGMLRGPSTAGMLTHYTQLSILYSRYSILGFIWICETWYWFNLWFERHRQIAISSLWIAVAETTTLILFLDHWGSQQIPFPACPWENTWTAPRCCKQLKGKNKTRPEHRASACLQTTPWFGTFRMCKVLYTF